MILSGRSPLPVYGLQSQLKITLNYGKKINFIW